MSDDEWKWFHPSRDGDVPKGVAIETHEIRFIDTTGKIVHCKREPLWLAGRHYEYRPRSTATLSGVDDYAALRNVLNAAYDQSANGKGAERHGNGKAWTEQPIFTIAGQVGDGFNAGQAIKKIQEAQQMAARGEYEKARHEVLGAIVYAASLHVLWDEESK